MTQSLENVCRCSAAAVLAVCVTSSAIAAQPERERAQPPFREPDAPKPSAAAQRRIDGRLVELRSVELAGGRGRHLLGKVRTNDGRTVVVDLGREAALDDPSRLRAGQRLQATGREGTINRKPVLIADTFTVEGVETRVRRDRPPDAAQRDRSAAVPRRRIAPPAAGAKPRVLPHRTTAHRTVVGTLVDLRTVSLHDVASEHRLAMLRTSDGKTVVADLGGDGSPGLELAIGDEVVVRGEPARIDGQPVILALQVARFVSLEREAGDRKLGARPRGAPEPRNRHPAARAARRSSPAEEPRH